MKLVLTSRHYNSCEGFVTCMDGSEIVRQLLKLLSDYLIHGISKFLKRHNQKTFFHLAGLQQSFVFAHLNYPLTIFSPI